MPKEKEKSLVCFGANIRRIRETKGVSQEGLAFDCGLDRTYIGGAERGERNVTILSALKIATALDCKLSDLVDGI